MLPQSGSGIRSFFLSAIGLTAPGLCVSTSATRQGAAGANDNTLQQNEGVASSLNTNKANVIFPFSVGKYLAEHFHSPPVAPSPSASLPRATAPRRPG